MSHNDLAIRPATEPEHPSGTEPGPFVRERRTLVSCVTHRSYNLTVFFDTRFIPTPGN